MYAQRPDSLNVIIISNNNFIYKIAIYLKYTSAQMCLKYNISKHKYIKCINILSKEQMSNDNNK